MTAKKAFTLTEILLVVAIITLLIIGLLILINPFAQIGKAKDAKKMSDLDKLKNAIEAYYNDKGCYPTMRQLCYLGGENGEDFDGKVVCFVCGDQPESPNFSPYYHPLPCDPDHPVKKYAYAPEGDPNCPHGYRLYSNLNAFNPASDELDCGFGGCGVPPDYGYDYGVSSSNLKLGTSPYFFCITKTNTCDNCLSLTNCRQRPTCLSIYGTFDICCAENPRALGCY